MSDEYSFLKVKSLGIDTYRENIIFMRQDCEVCRSEGFSSLTRIVVSFEGKSIVATLNVVNSDILHHSEVSLSVEAMKRLGVHDGDIVHVSHLKPIQSLKKVRAKMHGHLLDEFSYQEIIKDIAAGHYSNVELAAFITSCVSKRLTTSEITSLTKAMVMTGEKLDWGSERIFDKHCVGGIPGNRTTPIVVSIVAASGLMIPKTSSRAITSPAGTADTMETLTKVDLSLQQIRKVVEKEGGCMAWGGAVQLSPADDILISVERSLDIDSESQMIASILSKKISAGTTDIIIDIPVGPSAKVRSVKDAISLQHSFASVGQAVNLGIQVVLTDGKQPVGFGIGPSLEAIDVLHVLQNEKGASADLVNHALLLSGKLLEMAGKCGSGEGIVEAKQILQSGKAFKKFVAICEAQGGFFQPKAAPFTKDFPSERAGKIVGIDNRTVARIAKLAGAPKAPTAGIFFGAHLGKNIQIGEPLLTIHAESQGELNYAYDYARSNHFIEIV
ncbi:MAG: thymidine phosphorylase family protein [Bacteroidetes bacterium]|nr:thymidine phosphorylase family protein [Bacteroidota bacterium]MBI3482502.1 thymidine phosphorylase family protein [Bacteroidota bacterium]